MRGRGKGLSGLEENLLIRSSYDRNASNITGAAPAADSDARARDGGRDDSWAGERAWHLGCHCEAGSRGAGTSGEGEEDPRRGHSPLSHAARGLLPTAVGRGGRAEKAPGPRRRNAT